MWFKFIECWFCSVRGVMLDDLQEGSENWPCL